MRFVSELTIDWYDNILKSFCTNDDNEIFYCCIVALDPTNDEKIYLCTDIKYLKGYKELIGIIETDSFKENWNRLSKLLKLNRVNKTYLIRTKNLRGDQNKIIPYKVNYSCPKKILWGEELPEILDFATGIDNWWALI
ncbi:hypothetical protein AB6735_20880 [Mucilaginibacter sp. RCC_168]|uniref:hypothetical protein n=1 Tax=Mucilaginibacter sp. RCC_168 TaxID=3239221 RepID=UPI003526138B